MTQKIEWGAGTPGPTTIPRKRQNFQQAFKKGEALAWLKLHVDHVGSDCVPWPFTTNHQGYGLTYYEGKCVRAHRLMTTLAHGDPKPMMHAAHSCGNKICVNPQHLRWATARENMTDKILHGTHNRGKRSGSVKLSEEDVAAIRCRVNSGDYQKDIATDYGVSANTIHSIASGDNWGWLVQQQNTKLFSALREIRHSMRQAKIPGNDHRREISLSLNIADRLLTEAGFIMTDGEG